MKRLLLTGALLGVMGIQPMDDNEGLFDKYPDLTVLQNGYLNQIEKNLSALGNDERKKALSRFNKIIQRCNLKQRATILSGDERSSRLLECVQGEVSLTALDYANQVRWFHASEKRSQYFLFRWGATWDQLLSLHLSWYLSSRCVHAKERLWVNLKTLLNATDPDQLNSIAHEVNTRFNKSSQSPWFRFKK